MFIGKEIQESLWERRGWDVKSYYYLTGERFYPEKLIIHINTKLNNVFFIFHLSEFQIYIYIFKNRMFYIFSLQLDLSRIQWRETDTIPKSICSENCPSGHIRNFQVSIPQKCISLCSTFICWAKLILQITNSMQASSCRFPCLQD